MVLLNALYFITFFYIFPEYDGDRWQFLTALMTLEFDLIPTVLERVWVCKCVSACVCVCVFVLIFSVQCQVLGVCFLLDLCGSVSKHSDDRRAECKRVSDTHKIKSNKKIANKSSTTPTPTSADVNDAGLIGLNKQTPATGVITMT